MSNYIWERIDGFTSISEFNRFLIWIEKQLEEGACEELLLDRDNQEYAQKRFFRSKKNGEIWELILPDPGYYSGAWGPANR